MPRGLVHDAGSARCVIRIRRGGISIQGPAVFAVPGSPHFYMLHVCGSLPSATDGNPHTQLPRRLAHSAQDPTLPLRLPGAQGQLGQEHTVTQPMSIVPGHSYRLCADDSNCLSGGINCLEMLAVCQSCQFFLPDIRGHHVLVRSDNRSVVSYINHQGGLVLERLCTLANDLLVWAQTNLHSLKATHVPGKMNQGSDMLLRNNVSSEEWTLHPLAVQKIWEVFGRARVDLFGQRMAQPFALCFPPSRSATAGTQASQGTMAQAYFDSPLLEEPTVGVRVIPGAESSPVEHPKHYGRS